MFQPDMNPLTSQLHFYSVGRVAENKRPSEKVVHVIPVEHLPSFDGDVKKENEQLELTGLDKDGNEYQMSLDLGTTVPCHWFNLHSNRDTAPDVRRNERVLIWRMGDSDKFYWSETNLDQNHRKLETVRNVYSATRDENDNEVTPDNHYFTEISTHKKKLTLHTTTADGEPFSYDIILDTKDGSLTVTDNDDNYLYLDSAEQLWHIHNKAGTEVKLDKQEIHGYAKGLIYMRSDTHIHADAPKIDLGEEAYLEPSMLGDKFAAYWQYVTTWMNNHIHIGNLGIPTSIPINPVNPAPALLGGKVYSKKNRNQ